MDRIDARTITVNGRTVTLTVEPDDDTTPMDADCYDADDIAAWRADDWRYVVVTVEGPDGATASLGGVEYGQIAGRYIDTDALISDPYVTVTSNTTGAERRTYTMVESLVDELS